MAGVYFGCYWVFGLYWCLVLIAFGFNTLDYRVNLFEFGCLLYCLVANVYVVCLFSFNGGFAAFAVFTLLKDLW